MRSCTPPVRIQILPEATALKLTGEVKNSLEKIIDLRCLVSIRASVLLPDLFPASGPCQFAERRGAQRREYEFPRSCGEKVKVESVFRA